MNPPRRVAILNGSPLRGSSVDLLLPRRSRPGRGARRRGGEADLIRCDELVVRPCTACGPDATTGCCVYHDGMDRVRSTLSARGRGRLPPIYFDGVSGPLKLVMDRAATASRRPSRCPTAAKIAARNGAHAARCVRDRVQPDHRYDLAERSVRGFLRWVGAKWEETIAWQHPDNVKGSVAGQPELLERARSVGRRLMASGPIEG